MEAFIKRIRDVDLGSPSRTLTDEQKHKRSLLRRGAYLVRDVSAGDLVRLEDLSFRRPCRGLAPDDLDSYVVQGCTYSENLSSGTELFPEHISRNP